MARWLDSLTRVLKFGEPFAPVLAEAFDPCDPRVRLRPLGDDWLCPFTGERVVAPSWDGTPAKLLQSPEIVQHLMGIPGLESKRKKPCMKTWPELVDSTVALRVREAANYKITAASGEWICPHCLQNTGVLRQEWDGSEAPIHEFVQGAWKHLESCQAFLRDRLGAKPLTEMARLRGLGTVRRELAARVARDLLFRVCDGTGAWVCPFSERAVPEINLYRLGWKPEKRDRILEYLLSPACPGHYSKWKTDKTAEALKRAVERASVERAETISLQAADLERDNLKRHLTLLRQSLSAQAVKTHTKAIRAAQRAMLPSRTPVIPRYDVGVLYEPGALLGGNFWHVFRAGPGCTGFVVGDVPEAGPGAAETMSAVLRCFQLRAAGCSSPAALLLKVNMDLAGELRRGQRATVFCAILDHTTSLVRCARAAHAPAVLAEAESCSLLPLRGGGKALGGADAEGFAKALQEYEVTIPPGGVLLLQTPGATAARNGAGKAFGEGQLDTALLVCAAYSPRSLLKYVKAVLEEHLSDEPHEDDVTLLAVKRLR